MAWGLAFALALGRRCHRIEMESGSRQILIRNREKISTFSPGRSTVVQNRLILDLFKPPCIPRLHVGLHGGRFKPMTRARELGPLVCAPLH